MASTVDVHALRGKHREGLSRLDFAALFSLGFSPLYHSVCYPALISSKATGEDKGRAVGEGATVSGFYYSRDERDSLWITYLALLLMMSCSSSVTV